MIIINVERTVVPKLVCEVPCASGFTLIMVLRLLET